MRTRLGSRLGVKKMKSDLTLVLGGAASGKSAWAENFVETSGLPKVYVATAQAFDNEMSAKIQAHRTMRGRGWDTRENPLSPGDALDGLPSDRAVLIDCATMWLTNLMLGESDIDAATDAFLAALDACPARIVVVSNEVGQGIVPDNALARRFREAQGRLNIRLAARADRVVQVVAGLPNVLKGQI
ncbi:bifunctional adenosylcobinamide kinase/adenosylcobinamide-phosphate guanylyltransferase [Pseudooceanicola sp. LIPI14-2-Ac024]|uniref:bifunctional adenosylcobinamide kinase/adenosylcobinamide-phosphate guanylyltransferase n=1 Tax=Pseudooceanicola sp. LIPI14-2-Ac024 TaxID=3344875 RepID=UPI0035CEF709